MNWQDEFRSVALEIRARSEAAWLQKPATASKPAPQAHRGARGSYGMKCTLCGDPSTAFVCASCGKRSLKL